MRVLVKLGGTLLEERGSRDAIARELARLAAGHELAIVHGGGKQMTRFLEERGIASRFVNGLRVSDEAVVDAAMKVIAGSVNKQLVASLTRAGVRAVGLSGVDGQLITARHAGEDLGFVGQPEGANGPLLELLAAAGYVPVVACIAADRAGTIYNVNADTTAVACAIAFRAERLVFLSDVPGVKDRSGRVLPSLDPADIAPLIQSGVAHGGMQAKLEAVAAALEAGVAEVVIASGREPDLAGRIAGDGLGTRFSTKPAKQGRPAGERVAQ